MAVQGTLWLAKRLSLNLNFSFLNRISLFLISSSHPIVLTRLGGLLSRPYTSRKISRYIEPLISWIAVTMLATIPIRRSLEDFLPIIYEHFSHILPTFQSNYKDITVLWEVSGAINQRVSDWKTFTKDSRDEVNDTLSVADGTDKCPAMCRTRSFQ